MYITVVREKKRVRNKLMKRVRCPMSHSPTFCRTSVSWATSSAAVLCQPPAQITLFLPRAGDCFIVPVQSLLAPHWSGFLFRILGFLNLLQNFWNFRYVPIFLAQGRTVGHVEDHYVVVIHYYSSALPGEIHFLEQAFGGEDLGYMGIGVAVSRGRSGVLSCEALRAAARCAGKTAGRIVGAR